MTEARLYELGFLLIPIIDKEEVPAAIKAVADIVGKEGKVEFVREGELRTLAYSMETVLNEKKVSFDKAYLSSLIFSADADAVARITTALKLHAPIIRSLILRRTPEDVEMENDRIKAAEARAKVAPEGEEKMTEAEMDKAIEELVIQ